MRTGAWVVVALLLVLALAGAVRPSTNATSSADIQAWINCSTPNLVFSAPTSQSSCYPNTLSPAPTGSYAGGAETIQAGAQGTFVLYMFGSGTLYSDSTVGGEDLTTLKFFLPYTSLPQTQIGGTDCSTATKIQATAAASSAQISSGDKIAYYISLSASGTWTFCSGGSSQSYFQVGQSATTTTSSTSTASTSTSTSTASTSTTSSSTSTPSTTSSRHPTSTRIFLSFPRVKAELGQTFDGSVEVTDTAPNPINPAGTVILSDGGFSGVFGGGSSGATCTLANLPYSTDTGYCKFQYTPTDVGQVTFTAAYSGDLAHLPSTGSESTTAVNPQTSTTTTSTGEGIPEFPYQLGSVGIVSLLLAISYVFARNQLSGQRASKLS